MIAAFARAARVLPDRPRRPSGSTTARGAARFIRDRMWRAADGTLLRRYRDGDAAIDGYAEDYAYLIWGLLELFQATAIPRGSTGRASCRRSRTSGSGTTKDGGWFSTTGGDPSVLLRLKEDYDGAEPSASSVSVLNLLTLAHLAGRCGGARRRPSGRSAATASAPDAPRA